MIKLFLDWPIGYTYVTHGDGTFALAQCYIDNRYYRDTLKDLIKQGREVLLDNGAWEFGKSMAPKLYRKVAYDLNPTYVVVPDTLENMEETIETSCQFLENWKANTTKTIIVPQGKNLKELIKCYNAIADRFPDKVDMLGVSKWQCKLMNRTALVDHLWKNANIKFKDVHFLGFSNFDELMYKAQERKLDGEFPHQWELKSIDTRFPIKKAFGPEIKFKDENAYYYTEYILGMNAITTASRAFQFMLSQAGW